MKTRWWILLFALVALVLGAALLLQLREQPPARYAEILSDGVPVRLVDLSEDQTFTVKAGGGYNVLTVENGTIRVREADCPGNDCVRRGAASSGMPIICLPHRLVIRFTNRQGLDGMAG